VNIQIGRGKTARRAYGIDEIALVPGRRTVDPRVIDTSWSIGGITREIPIIASAMDGVVDAQMAVKLSELGALGVINLEGVQMRYADPNEVLDRIAAASKEDFVGLMQELYAEPIKPELIAQRIRENCSGGGGRPVLRAGDGGFDGTYGAGGRGAPGFGGLLR
jgi:IMP dehydrogenase